MRVRTFVMLAVLLALPLTTALGGEVAKETFVYAVKDGDTLRMDKYDIPGGEEKPCVIFMFGGGFFTGARDKDYYVSYFEYLAENGYVAVSIDYRLGFKVAEPPTDKKIKKKDFLSYFKYTVDLAVADLFDATNYVLANSEEWGVDPELIVTCGSSAGAVSVLHGEYERSRRSEIASVLPADFKYAGVVSFAGAIYSTEGKLKWGDDPAPLMLFHGDADKNVPYNKLELFKYGFYGSKSIAKGYHKKGYPYNLYVFENASHRIAGTPMTDDRNEIMSFLDKYVMKGEKIQSETMVSPIEKEKVNKKYKINTYVKSNFVGPQ